MSKLSPLAGREVERAWTSAHRASISMHTLTVPSHLRCEVLTAPSELADIDTEWRALFRHSCNSSVFQHPDWACGWWRQFWRGRNLFLVVLHDAETLVGVVPLMIDSALGELQFIGHPLNDRNGAVVKQGYRRLVWAVTFKLLGSRAPDNRINFPELTENDLVACLSATDRVRQTMRLPSPLIDLPSTWDDYAARLSRRRMRAWQRAGRRLEETGEPRFECLTGADLTSDRLTGFHRDRLRRFGSAGRLHELSKVERSDQFGQFLAELAASLGKESLLQLGRLCVGERRAAQNLYLRWPGVVLDYMQTFDPDFGPYSPGMLGLLHGIRHFIDQAVPVFDFGRGDEEYKFVLGALPRDLAGIAHVE